MYPYVNPRVEVRVSGRLAASIKKKVTVSSAGFEFDSFGTINTVASWAQVVLIRTLAPGTRSEDFWRVDWVPTAGKVENVRQQVTGERTTLKHIMETLPTSSQTTWRQAEGPERLTDQSGQNSGNPTPLLFFGECHSGKAEGNTDCVSKLETEL